MTDSFDTKDGRTQYLDEQGELVGALSSTQIFIKFIESVCQRSRLIGELNHKQIMLCRQMEREEDQEEMTQAELEEIELQKEIDALILSQKETINKIIKMYEDKRS